MPRGIPKTPKTHCVRGHLLDEQNTYTWRNPTTGRMKRQCRACRIYWHADERESRRERERAYRQTPKERRRVRNKHLVAKYGITVEDEIAMHDAQGGRCATCGTSKPHALDALERGEKPLVVDHCHETGKVRGLLCDPCNNALGRANDDAVLLRRLADYVEGSRCSDGPPS